MNTAFPPMRRAGSFFPVTVFMGSGMPSASAGGIPE